MYYLHSTCYKSELDLFGYNSSQYSISVINQHQMSGIWSELVWPLPILVISYWYWNHEIIAMHVMNNTFQKWLVSLREDPSGLRQLAACVSPVQQEVHIKTETHNAHKVKYKQDQKDLFNLPSKEWIAIQWCVDCKGQNPTEFQSSLNWLQLCSWVMNCFATHVEVIHLGLAK